LLPSSLVADWPVGEQRGQLTRIPRYRLPEAGPALPFSGSGYALSLENGDLLCGATASRDDTDSTLRENDHLQNLQRLHRLLGWQIEVNPSELQGRVGWRFHTADRLPIVGPISSFASPKPSRPITRLRDLPAEPGLFAATALGSRGITWAPLAGAVIAHAITGEPAPLPTSLLEAIDPRRFALKRSRRALA
jgi:tRNA 5-methylaminomethyl-2-thiouridine biosynthesis bifunctional protein